MTESSEVSKGMTSMTSQSLSSMSSNSSSSSESATDFVLYSQRQDWKDIKPLPQDDGPHPVVAIAYSEVFRETFDYFRAILAKNELSLRALELTEDCASLNPSNYTIWFFRRRVIQELGTDLFKELKYIESVIFENPKNYQVWQHRKCVVQQIKDMLTTDATNGSDVCMESELKLKQLSNEEKLSLAVLIRQDSKNYHCWQHRQWLINEFNTFDDELDYTEELIEDDIRNNSAWNHRYYVIANTTGFVGAVLDSEIRFTCSKIDLAPNNESAWNYLRGILAKVGLNYDQSVQRMCDQLFRTLETHRSPHLLSFIIDSIDETLSKQTDFDKSLLNKALELCAQLAKKFDVIRQEFWFYIARDLQNRYQTIE